MGLRFLPASTWWIVGNREVIQKRAWRRLTVISSKRTSARNNFRFASHLKYVAEQHEIHAEEVNKKRVQFGERGRPPNAPSIRATLVAPASLRRPVDPDRSPGRHGC